MFLGLFKAEDKTAVNKKIEIDTPEKNLLANTFLIICVVVVICFWYLGIRFWVADTNFAKAQATTDINQKIKYTEKAVALNSNVYQYYVYLASTYWESFANDLSGQKVDDKSDIIFLMDSVPFIDVTGVIALESSVLRLKKRKVTIYLVGEQKPLAEVLNLAERQRRFVEHFLAIRRELANAREVNQRIEQHRRMTA